MVERLSRLFPDLSSLADVFRKYPDIQAVYLFGSGASGRLHGESDLDLAVYSHNPVLRAQRLDILTDLARRGFSNVDLVFLDKNDIVLRECFKTTHLTRKRRSLTPLDALESASYAFWENEKGLLKHFLRFEAVRQNRLVYRAKDFDAGSFFSLVVRQYFDFAPYLKTQREAYKRRILHNGQDRSYS